MIVNVTNFKKIEDTSTDTLKVYGDVEIRHENPNNGYNRQNIELQINNTFKKWSEYTDDELKTLIALDLMPNAMRGFNSLGYETEEIRTNGFKYEPDKIIGISLEQIYPLYQGTNLSTYVMNLEITYISGKKTSNLVNKDTVNIDSSVTGIDFIGPGIVDDIVETYDSVECKIVYNGEEYSKILNVVEKTLTPDEKIIELETQVLNLMEYILSTNK